MQDIGHAVRKTLEEMGKRLTAVNFEMRSRRENKLITRK